MKENRFEYGGVTISSEYNIMTIRHYTLLAHIIRDMDPVSADFVAAHFAEHLDETQDNFNAEQFMEACDVG